MSSYNSKDAASLMRRYKSAENAAAPLRSRYQRAFELCAPNQNNFDKGSQEKSPGVYDSTCAISADSYTRTFMNTVTPTHTRWADLECGDGLPYLIAAQEGNPQPTKDDIDEIKSNVNDELGDNTETIFSYINSSNLYMALGTMYYSCFIGTGAMLAMPGDDHYGNGSPLNFRAIPIDTLALEEGPYGEISGVFRKICERVRNIKIEWSDIGELGVRDEEDKIEMIEATYYEPKINKWCYNLIYDDRIVLDRKYNTNPWIIYRGDVLPGEVFGRGPMMKILPDAELLNEMKNLSLKSTLLSAYGAYTVVSDDIINPNAMEIFPGALIPVKRNAGASGPSIQPLPGVGNIQAQLLGMQDLEQKIRRFSLDDSLPAPAVGPNMTATEVVERVRKIQKDFGAVFGRISYELLQPILQRTIDILMDKGLLVMPEIFRKIDNFTVKMKVVSPIARLQSMQDVEALTQVIQLLGGIDPNLIQEHIRLDKLPSWLAEKLGAPNKFIRSQEEVDAIKMQEQQASMMQQQMAMAQQQPQQTEML